MTRKTASTRTGGRRPPKRKPGLTAKQERFCREYLIDHNGAAAARRAGYAWHSARVTAAKLLAKANIQARIRTLTEAAVEQLEIKAVDVLRNVQNVAMSDIRQLFTEAGHLRSIEDLPPAVAAAISSVEVVTKQAGAGQVDYVAKVKLWDKMRALELLVKYLQLIKPEPTGREAIVAELFPPEVLNAMSDEELAVAKKLLQRQIEALRS